MKNIKINFFLVLFFFGNIATAQDFEVSPASLVFVADPFENVKQTLSVTNHSNKPTNFSLTYVDFIFDKDGKIEMVTNNSTENSCSQWLVPDKDVFEVQPNETFTFNINMLVPIEDYKARWSYIFVQTSQERTSYNAEKAPQAGINLSARIAVKVFRRPKTKQPALMEIKDLIEIPDSTNNSRRFSVEVENSGNDIQECSLFFIASHLGTAQEYEFETIKFNSFPGFKRKLYLNLPYNKLPEGEYSLMALLDYGSRQTIKGARMDKKLIILKNE